MNNNAEELQDDFFKEESNLQNQEAVSIQVINESVIINKRIVESGSVTIKKNVTEESVVLDIPLEHDEIEVNTIAINQFVDTIPPPVRYEGDTMIIPVLKEVSVVRIMLEKEIRITKKKVVVTTAETIALRKEEVVIERSSADNSLNHQQ